MLVAKFEPGYRAESLHRRLALAVHQFWMTSLALTRARDDIVVGAPMAQINKSFLLLFFKKVALILNLKDQTE